jgi:phosphatidylglycerophosphate synthase
MNKFTRKPEFSSRPVKHSWRAMIPYALPMFLTLMRILIAVSLMIDAIDRKVGPYFLAAFTVAWLFDVLDGFLARKLGVTSRLGAIFDGLADLTLYGCVTVCVFCTYPAIAYSMARLLLFGLAAQLIHDSLGIIKFRRIVSYHSRLAKVISVFAFLSVVEIFGFNHSYHLASLALILWIISNIEGITMTIILPDYVNNVPDIFSALRYRHSESLAVKYTASSSLYNADI